MKYPNNLKLFAALIFSLSGTFSVTGQTASATLEREKILVGEQIRLNVRFSFPAAIDNFQLPVFEQDTITKSIEIISRYTTDSLSTDQTLREIEQTYIITSFDSGTHVIPSQVFSYFSPSEADQQFLLTDSLYLNVDLVRIDTTKAIMDIKNPWGIPFHWREYLPYFIAGFILLLLILAGIYYYMRRKKGLPLFPSRITPPLPADEEALLALNRIKKEKIWKSGLVKEYYTHLTDTVRRYLERRFNIPALEFTSAETLSELSKTETDAESVRKLEHILNVADLVKFARAHPEPTEHENCLNFAFDFIQHTKPVITEIQNENESPEQNKPTEE